VRRARTKRKRLSEWDCLAARGTESLFWAARLGSGTRLRQQETGQRVKLRGREREREIERYTKRERLPAGTESSVDGEKRGAGVRSCYDEGGCARDGAGLFDTKLVTQSKLRIIQRKKAKVFF